MVLTDITEKKQAEAEASSLQAELQQAQKMEATGVWPAAWRTTSTICSRLSGYPLDAELQQGVERDGTTLLPKTFTPDRLRDSVEPIL